MIQVSQSVHSIFLAVDWLRNRPKTQFRSIGIKKALFRDCGYSIMGDRVSVSLPLDFTLYHWEYKMMGSILRDLRMTSSKRRVESWFLMTLFGVLVFSGCFNKLPCTRWLKQLWGWGVQVQGTGRCLVRTCFMACRWSSCCVLTWQEEANSFVTGILFMRAPPS